MHRGRNGHDQFPRKLDFIARPGRQKLARQPPSIELAVQLQDLLHGIDRGLRQVNHRRVHLHHPPPGDIDRQVDDMVHVRVRDKPRRRAHECPRLGAEIKAKLELGNPPIGLHSSPRITLDGQVFVGKRFYGQVIDHSQQFPWGAIVGKIGEPPRSFAGVLVVIDLRQVQGRGGIRAGQDPDFAEQVVLLGPNAVVPHKFQDGQKHTDQDRLVQADVE